MGQGLLGQHTVMLSPGIFSLVSNFSDNKKKKLLKISCDEYEETSGLL